MALPVLYAERLLGGGEIGLVVAGQKKIVKLRYNLNACVVDITQTKTLPCVKKKKKHYLHILHDRQHYCLLVTLSDNVLFNSFGLRDMTSGPFIKWCSGQIKLVFWNHRRLQRPTTLTCGFWTLAFAQAVSVLHKKIPMLSVAYKWSMLTDTSTICVTRA